ncbi:MAG: YraN family protein [Pseudomonadota bacterium]
MQDADTDRRLRGRTSQLAGAAAEYRIADDYARRGYRMLHQRWRGKAGEIDLIFEGAGGLVFVEVKKSRCFDRALASLSTRQVKRIYRAAEEYAGAHTDGALVDMRFDVALMNETGETRVLENVTALD